MLQTYFSKLIQLIALCAAIAWKKKKFKSNFINEANYIQFTKLTTRLLDAHTTQFAHATQLEIVEWLCTEGENAAASWFERYWAGERGNYTNASAGYSSNNNAQGIESRWRYLKRDFCGAAGTNLSLPLKGFIPFFLTYCKTSSAQHMGKLVKSNEGTCTHFPVKPTILPDMWKAAQRMDDRTLLLSHIECNYDHQRAFKRIAEEIAACCQEKTPLLEKIPLWYGMGGNMHSI